MSAPGNYTSASHWVVALPNGLGSAKASVDHLHACVDARGGAPAAADVAPFNIPPMKVGTLDVLMTLSDDLQRADTYVEGVVRKVERQVFESTAAKRSLDGSAPAHPDLRVNGSIVSAYVMSFKWDAEQFDAKEPLPDLVRRLVGSAEKVDADIRSASSAYTEKKTALQALERKRGGNLMVASLDDVITERALADAGAEIVPADSEYLASVVIVVPKAGEEGFLATYASLDNESVPYGPTGNRESVRGSPVVPGSAKRITEDKDGYVLYIVTILKKFMDSFRTACREKRITIRDFTFNPSAAGTGAQAAADLSVQVASALNHLYGIAGRKFGEAFSIWMHIKAVRIFVESVLRYGLPVNFVAVVMALPKGGARKAIESVRETWAALSGAQGASLDDIYGDSGKGGDVVIPGLAEAGAASFPFVLLDFDINKAEAR